MSAITKTIRLSRLSLPPNAENFLNTEAEYLRNCCDWKDGTALEMKRGDENRVYHVQ